MMMQRTTTLLTCLALVLLNTGIINLAYAEQKNSEKKQMIDSSQAQGKVTDIIDTAGYSYAEINIGTEKVWVAGPKTALKIGDKVTFSTQMPMENFHSKSMNRDFPIIYFINRFITDKKILTTNVSTTASPHKKSQKKAIIKPIDGITKVEGGYTIAEIYTDKQNLNGKTIRIRGQVTKFSAKILGKNWLHIRDSSTLDDLTITTNDTVTVDDIIVIEGKLALDRDYKYGYFYPVILEEAKIIK